MIKYTYIIMCIAGHFTRYLSFFQKHEPTYFSSHYVCRHVHVHIHMDSYTFYILYLSELWIKWLYMKTVYIVIYCRKRRSPFSRILSDLASTMQFLWISHTHSHSFQHIFSLACSKTEEKEVQITYHPKRMLLLSQHIILWNTTFMSSGQSNSLFLSQNGQNHPCVANFLTTEYKQHFNTEHPKRNNKNN